MVIDKKILDKSKQIPTIGSLENGDTFLHNDELYMKCKGVYNTPCAINLATGELIDLYDSDKLTPNTGIVPIDCIISER